MNLVDEHKELCNMLNRIYAQKNKAYGDSFGKQYREFGIVSALIRITDKYERMKNLALNPKSDVGDEPIIDTLIDLANYSLMTVMELTRGGNDGKHT